MRRFRPTDFVRVILATAVLLGSVASTPIFGHAHERPEADRHDHLDWAAHEHSHLHAARHAEQHTAVEANDAVFHLHGMWFGIPFSLAAPTEAEDARLVANPLAMAVPTPAVTIVASRVGSVRERIVCPNEFGLASDSQAGLEPSATLLSGTRSLGRCGGHCALEARSGVLRC